MNIGGLVRRPVHLRVLLGGVEQRGDALARVGDLVHQRLGLDGVSQPARGHPAGTTCADVVDRRRHPLEPVDVQPSLDERRRIVPAAGDAVVLEPVADARPRGPTSPGRSVRRLTWRPARPPRPACSIRRAAPRGRTCPRPTSPACAHLPKRSRRSAAARAAAAAGIVQLVGQPGESLPSASSFSRWPIDLAGAHADEQCPRADGRPSGTTVDEAARRLGVQDEEPRRLGHPHRRLVTADWSSG